VTDTDFPAAKAARAFALTIAAAPAITTTSPLPAGTQGTTYQVTLTATGGTAPLAWSVSAGALPDGLTLSGTGVLGGTPTAVGTFNFTARIIDAANATVTKALALTIVAPPSVTTSSLPGGSVGAPYLQALAVTGGTAPFTWTVISGALPASLSLSPGGSISGTPTTAGTFNFTVQVTDAVGATATKALSITVTVDTIAPTLTITSPAPPTHTATSTPLTVTGTAGDNVGVAQVTWQNDRGGSGTATGTPSWTASGIALLPGKNIVTFTVRDAANNTATATLTAHFFQDVLTAAVTPVRALHFLQLATAIENLRARFGAPGAFGWTGAAPAATGIVKASHLNDLRAGVGALYDQAGVAVGSTFTRTAIAVGAPITTGQIAELRTALRTLSP
jgi:hypothetical protein